MSGITRSKGGFEKKVGYKTTWEGCQTAGIITEYVGDTGN